jgi:hypothetical protein
VTSGITDLKRVFELEIKLDTESTYLKSYPILLQHVAQKEHLSFEDIAVFAHMVYGWMPTILKLHFNQTSSDKLVSTVNAAKERQLTADEMELIKCFINNSLVGASKLLHFIAPDRYAIWDSKIYRFLFKKTSYQHSIGDIQKYFAYLQQLEQLEKCDEFTDFFANVNAQLNHNVTPKRALELMMFVNSEK